MWEQIGFYVLIIFAAIGLAQVVHSFLLRLQKPRRSRRGVYIVSCGSSTDDLECTVKYAAHCLENLPDRSADIVLLGSELDGEGMEIAQRLAAEMGCVCLRDEEELSGFLTQRTCSIGGDHGGEGTDST